MSSEPRQVATVVAAALVGAGAAALLLSAPTATWFWFGVVLTLMSAGVWLSVVVLCARGVLSENPSQLLAHVLVAIACTLMAVGTLYLDAMLWPVLGLGLLFAFGGGLYKLRAISTKYANQRAAHHG